MTDPVRPPDDGARQLAIAERIAREAHAGQKEESTGDDYILHVARVVAMVDGADAKAVAWLHDVLEDSNYTAAECRRYGISESVVAAVELLTRSVQSYAQYIDSIKASGNALAIAVKIADLRDHLRPNCPARLRSRYEAALKLLVSDDGVRPPEAVEARKSLGIIELLTRIGEDHVGVQNLVESATNFRTRKGGVTAITFLTDQMTPSHALRGNAPRIGLVIWLPTDRVNDARAAHDRDEAL